ncbi:hypothetical protein [Pseudomonas sp. HS6]|uniref:hypothetical protein n=1 Tax=Pseudomonas sp. HS6 TaxID=2850559 RepID=UPI00201978B4|nr:hypothetical protein [Pseudomonas sp. HS6]UQS17626.1 hypothetical protein JJN09_12425 [Pseudomonas sp. HS6]
MRAMFTSSVINEAGVTGRNSSEIALVAVVRGVAMAVNLGFGLRQIKTYDSATLETQGFQWIASP